MASRAVNTIVYAVRHLLNDTSPAEPVLCSLPKLLNAMERAMFAVEGALPAMPTLSTTFITVAANDYDYSVGSDFVAINSFRRASDGRGLVRISPKLWLALRTGQTVETGDPEAIAFEESAAGAATALLWPTPNKTDTIEAFREAAPSTFSTQGILASADLSAVSLNMPVYAHEAFIFRVAWELARLASPEKLARLGLGDIGGFMENYREAMGTAVDVANKLRRPSGIVKKGIS